MRPAAITRVVCLAFAATSLLASCSMLPCAERRHESGLLLVCQESFTDTSESLKAAWAFAWELAEQHPDAFGFPWANAATGELELRVTGPAADPFVREWPAGRATRGTGEKTLPLPAPEVPIRLVTVDRSFRTLVDLQHGAVPPKDLPDGALIWMTAPDQRRNAIVIGVDHVSDALLHALAERYGTAAVVVRIERNPRAGY